MQVRTSIKMSTGIFGISFKHPFFLRCFFLAMEPLAAVVASTGNPSASSLDVDVAVVGCAASPEILAFLLLRGILHGVKRGQA